MALLVVGAGLPRTGTMSLYTALPELVSGRCYHMAEVGEHPEHVEFWGRATDGVTPAEWREFFADYDAAVDYPASLYWRELAEVFPDAPVLLSKRDSPQTWWRSMDKTIFTNVRRVMSDESDAPAVTPAFAKMMQRSVGTFGEIVNDEHAAAEFYERHLAEVRATIPADRLVEWQPGDGWQPLADMLGVPAPDKPYPHVNSADDFEETSAKIRAALTPE